MRVRMRRAPTSSSSMTVGFTATLVMSALTETQYLGSARVSAEEHAVGRCCWARTGSRTC